MILLVVETTLTGFCIFWTILINSGASRNYARRRSMAGSHPYAKALNLQNSETFTVHLATRTCVKSPKIAINVCMIFLDFDNMEHCLGLQLDPRYDITWEWHGLNAMIHEFIEVLML